MFGFGGSKTIVGLDIGSSSIKAVELKTTRAGLELSHVGSSRWPMISSGLHDYGRPQRGQRDHQAVRRFGDQVEGSRHFGQRTLRDREADPLPTMTEDELAETINKEAAQHIPFDIADVNIDYQILSEDLSGPQMDVLLVAVKKDKILNYTNVLSHGGQGPGMVDIDVFALQNCYEYNYDRRPVRR